MLIKDGTQGNIFFLKSTYTHRIRFNSHDICEKCHYVFEGCNWIRSTNESMALWWKPYDSLFLETNGLHNHVGNEAKSLQLTQLPLTN